MENTLEDRALSGTSPLQPLFKPRFGAGLLTKPFLRLGGTSGSGISIAPLLKKRPVVTWVAMLLLVVYLIFCTGFLYAFSKPEAEGTGSYAVGPDSRTYYLIGRDIANASNDQPIVSLSSNLLGPIALVLYLKDATLIAIFDTSLFLIALYIASTIRGVRFAVFAVLMILDPEIISALTTVNKEIFAIFSIVLFAKYIDSGSKSKSLLLLILATGLMARWQQDFVILLFLYFRRSSLFRGKPVRGLLTLITALTLMAPIVLRLVDLTQFDAYVTGARTMAVLNVFEKNFGYFLVVIPKSIMNLIGQGFSPVYWFSSIHNLGPEDLQNRYLIRGHELITTCLLVVAIWRRLLKLDSSWIYFGALYMAFTSVNLFVQARYNMPVYVLLCLEISLYRTTVASNRKILFGSAPKPLEPATA